MTVYNTYAACCKLTFPRLGSLGTNTTLIHDGLVQWRIKTFAQRSHESRRAAIFVVVGGAIIAGRPIE